MRLASHQFHQLRRSAYASLLLTRAAADLAKTCANRGRTVPLILVTRTPWKRPVKRQTSVGSADTVKHQSRGCRLRGVAVVAMHTAAFAWRDWGKLNRRKTWSIHLPLPSHSTPKATRAPRVRASDAVVAGPEARRRAMYSSAHTHISEQGGRR